MIAINLSPQAGVRAALKAFEVYVGGGTPWARSMIRRLQAEENLNDAEATNRLYRAFVTKTKIIGNSIFEGGGKHGYKVEDRQWRYRVKKG